MGIQSVINFLLPKEDKFYALLEKQGTLSYDAAVALAGLADPERVNTDIANVMQALEHQGDKLVNSVEEELAKSFVTPIDREDIHNLSVELDDIIDFCNQAARSCVLFKIKQPTKAMVSMLDILVKCTAHMRDVIPALRKHDFNAFRETKGAVKELEKQADKIYRWEITTLFADLGSNEWKSYVAQKEVLDKLENAVDRCEDITQLLINLAVKHG